MARRAPDAGLPLGMPGMGVIGVIVPAMGVTVRVNVGLDH